MNIQFKPGDTVRCINAKDNWGDFLESGALYTVEKTDQYSIKFQESPIYWLSNRFELVKPIQTMNKPLVIAELEKQKLPECFYRAVIALPIDTKGNLLPAYQKDDVELLGEELHGRWGIKLDNYRYSAISGKEFCTPQEALDAGEKLLRETFAPKPVEQPVSAENIRYVDL